MKYDYLIVGSGLFGATFAYCANKRGLKCLVIDKRSHLGGNVYCENIEGINVHKYGIHVFHTSNKTVWDFVNSFVPFNRFTLNVLANNEGKLYNLPFNMNTFYQIWGVTTPEEARKIIDCQIQEAKENIEIPQNLEEQALCLVGRDIYELLIREYTEKQWGRKCTELPPFIIKRLPLRFYFDNNYFNDKYQGVPIGGYNKLIEGMLDGIECKINTDFFESEYRDWHKYANKLVYTGQIDKYYDYCYGRLEWRSLRFENEVLNISDYQGNAHVNFTSKEVPYTRIIEHKYFENVQSPKTVITKEYPIEFTKGKEPFYPINDSKNSTLVEKYKKINEEDVIFGGRLAEYKYYDMAPVIEKALSYFC